MVSCGVGFPSSWGNPWGNDLAHELHAVSVAAHHQRATVRRRSPPRMRPEPVVRSIDQAEYGHQRMYAFSGWLTVRE